MPGEHPPADPHNLAPLARRIVQRVAALGEFFPSMKGADPALHPISSMDTSELPWWDRFEARWDHEHGVSYERDPDVDLEADPHTARSPYRPVLDPQTGLHVTLWLYEGAWLGLDKVEPFEIGRLRVHVIVEAPNAELRKSVERAINEILETERARAAQ